MDPHLSAVRNWTKNYKPTEKEAYQLARNEGYIFPNINSIGSLTSEELEDIASHSPIVDLKRYKYYRNMDYDQLKHTFPALVDIIGSKITYEDLFYYATRGWIPEYDSINYKIDRWKQYNDISEVGQSLLDLLYDDIEGFVEGLGHPLEPYIIAYDYNLDDDAAIRSIGERIGIDISFEAPAHDIFYEKLANHIINHEPYGYQRIKRANSLPTKSLIDLTEKQYKDHIKSPIKYPNYTDRLSSIRKI